MNKKGRRKRSLPIVTKICGKNEEKWKNKDRFRKVIHNLENLVREQELDESEALIREEELKIEILKKLKDVV